MAELDKSDLAMLVKNALVDLGGSAPLVAVARHIWEHHEPALKRSGDLLYTWQYDMRWAATKLRESGELLPTESSPRGIWELTSLAK